MFFHECSSECNEIKAELHKMGLWIEENRQKYLNQDENNKRLHKNLSEVREAHNGINKDMIKGLQMISDLIDQIDKRLEAIEAKLFISPQG